MSSDHYVAMCTQALIDIPERDRHVHTYIARIDPSFKASR